jgi:hypothetical protein
MRESTRREGSRAVHRALTISPIAIHEKASESSMSKRDEIKASLGDLLDLIIEFVIEESARRDDQAEKEYLAQRAALLFERAILESDGDVSGRTSASERDFFQAVTNWSANLDRPGSPGKEPDA